MKKILIGIVIGLLLGVLGYYFLTTLSSKEIVPRGYARVTIKNESGIKAKKIVLKHERGAIEASELKDKEELRFIFKNLGENSYNVSVTFDNDSILTSKFVYFERGYRGTEIIRNSEIITENNW